MASTKKKDTNSIPQRTDIEDRHKWNLADLYKSDQDWEAEFSKAESKLENAKTFVGNLSKSPDILFSCLESRTEISEIVFNLFQYAKLNRDLDGRISTYQAMTDRATMLSSRLNEAFAFVEPELLLMDENSLNKTAEQFPKTTLYDFYIKDFNRSRAHIRSKEIEELLAQASMVGHGPSKIFNMFDSADIIYPEMEDENGKVVRLTKQRFAKFMESSSQKIRCEANEKFYLPYENNLNSLGAMLSTSVNNDIFYARARKFTTSLDSSLDAYNIPISVYHSLIETTENNLSGIHEYLKLRKEILKLEKQYPYDIFCPLLPDIDFDIKYNDAIDKVLKATKPLGEKYTRVLGDGFAKRWVDVYETDGKKGGAYNWGNYSSHPFVLMNFNSTLNNLFTLAHEMGHAMHSHLSNTNQPLSKASYSIFVAEVASTLNEGLLQDYLIKKSNDKKEKMYLLNQWLTGAMGTYFHQVLYAHFELEIHEMIENGKALSPEIMNKLLVDLSKKYYGPAVEIDDYYKYKWSRIPHFYRAYYVYQYATSFAASQTILSRLLSGEEGIIEKYLELLSSGGDDYPINQLKKCGVDMTTSEPFDSMLAIFAQKTDELKQLIG